LQYERVTHGCGMMWADNDNHSEVQSRLFTRHEIYAKRSNSGTTFANGPSYDRVIGRRLPLLGRCVWSLYEWVMTSRRIPPPYVVARLARFPGCVFPSQSRAQAQLVGLNAEFVAVIRL
jgi:hypothetical protein